MNFQLRMGERALFLALPEEGKTNLVLNLLQAGGACVYITPNPTEQEMRAFSRQGFEVTADWRQLRLARRVVYEVDALAVNDRAGWWRPGSAGYQWTQALGAIYERGSTIVVFGEVSTLLPAAGGHPLARKMYTQGRKPGISVWGESQHADWIDTLVLRMSEHLFCFANRSEQDLEALRRRGGRPDTSPIAALEPRSHAFCYHKQPMREWLTCEPVANLMDLGTRVPRRRSQKAPQTGVDERVEEVEPVL